MGTNYYWEPSDPCPTCGHPPQKRHIGKRSSGWVFALRVYPDEGIHDLEDWLPRLLGDRDEPDKQSHIVDEYGRRVEPQELVEIIKDVKEDLHSDTIGHNLNPGRTWRGSGGWDCMDKEFA